MPKIIVNAFLILDGVMQAPDARKSTSTLIKGDAAADLQKLRQQPGRKQMGA
jgi:hypothetical protein